MLPEPSNFLMQSPRFASGTRFVHSAQTPEMLRASGSSCGCAHSAALAASEVLPTKHFVSCARTHDGLLMQFGPGVLHLRSVSSWAVAAFSSPVSARAGGAHAAASASPSESKAGARMRDRLRRSPIQTL